MAGEILGFETTDGQWAGYGTLGWWIRTGFSAADASIPSGASWDGTAGSTSTLASGDARAMRFPDGSPYLTIWGGTSPVDFSFSFPTPTRVSLRLIAAAAGRPATVNVKNSGGTVLDTATSPDLFLGVWARLLLVGAGTINCVGTFPRYQGALFDAPVAAASPGRLLCFEVGRSGLVG